MKIILPVSHVDYRMSLSLMDWIYDLSGSTGMDWVVVHDPSLDVGSLLEKVQAVSTSVSYLKVIPANDSWPAAPNTFFADVAKAMNGERWYFFEADNTPIHPQWSMILEVEASKHPDKCVGAVHSFGKGIDGSHLAGTSIYPPGLWDRCPVLRSLREMTESMVRRGEKPRAFDTYLQGEITPISVHTPLICHQWRASNYRREKGAIRADVHPGFGLPEIVNKEAVNVHGCKDGSLIRLLRQSV